MTAVYFKLLLYLFQEKMNHNHISKTCPNCLRQTKVVLVDLNLFNPNGRKIRFKRCKKKISLEKDFCMILILDKISISMNGNFGCR